MHIWYYDNITLISSPFSTYLAPDWSPEHERGDGISFAPEPEVGEDRAAGVLTVLEDTDSGATPSEVVIAAESAEKSVADKSENLGF